jgi:hypothetical protein
MMTMLPIVIAVFALAGLVKGVIGLGLPTIAMGLLAVMMPPAEAAALLVVPSLVTNLWQMFDGPNFARLVERLWPLWLAVIAATLAGAGWLTGPNARAASALLGIVLMVYAGMALASIRPRVAAGSEWWAAPVVGALTGFVTAATGVFVMPAVPYLQALGLEKDDLVQALGISFMVATIALAGNLWLSGALGVAIGPMSLAAVVAACAGLWLGTRMRSQLDAAMFRCIFLIGLLLLGAYLAARGLP